MDGFLNTENEPETRWQFLNPTILQPILHPPATTKTPNRKWVWWTIQQIWSSWPWDLQDLTRWGWQTSRGPWPWQTKRPITYLYRVIQNNPVSFVYCDFAAETYPNSTWSWLLPVCYANSIHFQPTPLSRGGLDCRSIQLPSQDRLDMPAPLFPMKSNAVKQKGCRISLHFFPTTKYLKTLPTLISCIGSMNIFVGASNIPRSKIWRPGHWSTEPVVPWSELQLQGKPLLKMANFSKRSLVCY